MEIIELKKHKYEILNKSRLSENDFNILMKGILKFVKIVKTEDVIKYKNQADKIIGKIDKDDILFIATALRCNALIWSDDKHFQHQNKIRILTTQEILDLI